MKSSNQNGEPGEGPPVKKSFVMIPTRKLGYIMAEIPGWHPPENYVRLTRELEASGIHLDLVELTLKPYAPELHKATPILLRWLKESDDDEIKDAIVRTLTVPWAKHLAPTILDLFDHTESMELRWVIGNAMFSNPSDALFPRMLAIVSNPEFGPSRQMFVMALGKMKRAENISEAIPTLIELLKDREVRGHALWSLGRLRAVEARSEIEIYLTDESAYIRKEAKSALKRIDSRPRAKDEIKRLSGLSRVAAMAARLLRPMRPRP